MLVFFTATIYKWKHLLKPEKYKQVITESLKFLVEQGRVKIYCFVLMSNHIHLIWQMREGHKETDVQRDFLKYVSGKIKFDLDKNHPSVLAHFKVNAKDRTYQFWKRRALSIDLYSKAVFLQKLDYIHNNPIRAGLCILPENYMYSSASFYYNQDLKFTFLCHYDE